MTDSYIRRTAPAESGSATDWSRYSLDQIWDMVSNENGRVTYTQIDAWERMARLCNEQAEQLESATNQLLQRWPARPGSASEAFSANIATLVRSMRQAAKAGTANQQPLRNITSALVSAQADIASLLDTRRRYALAEQLLTPQPTPSPGQTPLPAAPANLKPPPAGWGGQLDQQARAIMSHADILVGAEAAQIQQPEPFGYHSAHDVSTPLFAGNDPGGVISSDGGGAQQAGFNRSAGMGSAGLASPFALTMSDGGGSGSASGGGGEDAEPILSGGGGPASPTIGAPYSAPGSAGPPAGGSLPGSFANPAIGGVIGPGGTIGARASTSATRAGATNGEPGLRAGNGGASSGAMGSRTSAQSGMPMAPMIPPRGGRSGGTGSAVPSGRIGRGGGRNRRTNGDPDDPWAVAEGGSPVLEPAPEPTHHDPGPGVIGLDR